MKLPLSVRVRDRRHGYACTSCKKIRTTQQIQLLVMGYVVQKARYCDVCIEKGMELQVTAEIDDFDARKKEKKKRVRTSQKLEKQRAADIGGRAQPGSGGTRLRGYKGDIRKMGSWRVEHKFTDALNNWILKLSDLAKIVQIAMEANENPALIIEFRRAREAFAVLPLALFLEMIDEAHKHQTPEARRRQKSS